MQNTTNYNLNKPEGNDFVKVEFLNENADIIDGKLKELEDGLDNIDFSSVNQAIAKAFKAIPDGYTLGGAGFNFNTIATNSVYQVGRVEDTIGGPPESWGILRDYKPAEAYRIQEFTGIVGDRKYTRRCDYGASQDTQWTPWKQVSFDENIYQQWNQGFETYRRFPEYCQTITDWNDVVQNGFYMGNSTANSPGGDASWFMGLVIVHNASWIVQKLMRFGDNANNLEFERIRVDGAWQPWVETSPRKLFQSVSNGKVAIANAITGKGVATSATAEFATMANNINAINTGKKFATGTATAGGPIEFIAGNSTSTTSRYIEVGNLNFTPSRVQAYITNVEPYPLRVYNTTVFSVNSVYFAHTHDFGTTDFSTSDANTVFRLSPGTHLWSGGFRIPVEVAGAYTWVAYE